MGQDSAISWTDHTFNPWWGCVEVSPGCDHCYARTLDARWRGGNWGAEAPRRLFAEKHWNEPLKWNRLAAAAGERKRVFCASMGDVFEYRPGWAAPDGRTLDSERARLFELIEATPALDWMLLTKRPQNMVRLAPARWNECWPANVIAMATLEDAQHMWRAEKLAEVPAQRRGLSMEPLLSAVHIPERLLGKLDWIIVGGESGAAARPTALRWATDLRDQAMGAGITFHFKQWGEWAPENNDDIGYVAAERVEIHSFVSRPRSLRVGRKAAGRHLEGRTWDEYPEIGGSRTYRTRGTCRTDDYVTGAAPNGN